MSVKIITGKKTVCALIAGDIDHHTARDIRNTIDKAVKENSPVRLILDFSAVTFMDSSGIGLVMGRFKLMNELGGKVIVAKPPAYISKVMRISGINRIAGIVSDYTIPQEDEITKEVENVETKIG